MKNKYILNIALIFLNFVFISSASAQPSPPLTICTLVCPPGQNCYQLNGVDQCCAPSGICNDGSGNQICCTAQQLHQCVNGFCAALPHK